MIKKTSVCFLSYKGNSYLVSKNCQSSCLALEKRLFDPASFEADPARGNPSYQICRAVNGFPEIAFVKVKGKVEKMNRCIFKDGSFVGNDYLYN